MQRVLTRIGTVLVLAGSLGSFRLTANHIAPSGELSQREPNAVLVYNWRPEEGPSDILSIDADTGKSTNLTRSKAQEFDPVWSPDHKQIAFAALKQRNERRTDIYVMDADGSHRRQLTHSGPDRLVGSPAWSPDGRSIAFHRVQLDRAAGDLLVPEIYVIDAQGRNQRRVTQGLAPSWSPDGKSLLYLKVSRNATSQNGIWRIDADGSNPQRLVKTSMSWEASAASSPDGTRIAYPDGLGEQYGIYMVGRDGSNPTQLSHAKEEYTGLQWTADGRHLVFTRMTTSPFLVPEPGKVAVYVMDVDGTHVKQLAQNALTSGGVYGTICVQFVIAALIDKNTPR